MTIDNLAWSGGTQETMPPYRVGRIGWNPLIFIVLYPENNA